MSSGIKREREAPEVREIKKQKHSQPLCEPPPGLEIPDGWLDCPPSGNNIKIPGSDFKSGIIPCKVPLGPKFGPYVGNKAFTPANLLQLVRKRGYEVGLVIDLTNSYRYYDPKEFLEENIQYVKIQCRGRGETPDAANVNEFCFEVLKFKAEQKEMMNRTPGPPKHIVVHCTHGFNRTGFMIANWMVRYENMSASKAVKTFAAHRQPGIYKDDYLQTFFHYHHQLRNPLEKTPPVPGWKGEEEPEGLELTVEDIEDAEQELKHDDEIGETITQEEEQYIQSTLHLLVTGRELGEGGRPQFPGGQPVSLARSNLGLLNEKRYMVTWKADGTRYLLLICSWGCYFMDRAFKVRRVQMRFPNLHPDPLKQRHHLTLLDGEMVVDEDMETGKQRRRFLAYDMLVLNGDNRWIGRGFEERWQEMEKSVIAPRRQEREKIEKALYIRQTTEGAHTSDVLPYKYDQELVSVRRKGFWPLPKARDLLDNFIDNLSHECDGLILQPADSRSRIGTCDDLLKWKFSHLNSVDFTLQISPSGEKQLALLETRKDRGGGAAHMKTLPGAKINISREDAERLVDTVIECSWNAENQTWSYMRERHDKETPNAYHVFEKVMRSIEDNIKQENLLEAIDKALENPIYERDVAPSAQRHP